MVRIRLCYVSQYHNYHIKLSYWSNSCNLIHSVIFTLTFLLYMHRILYCYPDKCTCLFFYNFSFIAKILAWNKNTLRKSVTFFSRNWFYRPKVFVNTMQNIKMSIHFMFSFEGKKGTSFFPLFVPRREVMMPQTCFQLNAMGLITTYQFMEIMICHLGSP